MTKEQIGKEIKELIRSIKTHYTFVEEEDRIPLIELELITSKIRKLYEKSIINNYLHSNDESYMSQERSRRFHDRANFERNKPVTFVPKVTESPLVEKQETMTPPTPQIVAEQPQAHPTAEEVMSTPKVEEASKTTKSTSSEKVIKDLKMLIGINDKFLLINNLFARNDGSYKLAIEQLSTLRTFSEAENYVQGLARQNNWNTESYAFVRLLQILEKRYK